MLILGSTLLLFLWSVYTSIIDNTPFELEAVRAKALCAIISKRRCPLKKICVKN